jgi:transposase
LIGDKGFDAGWLRERLPAAAGHSEGRRPQPDWAAVHRELRRSGVTLQLLWEEHRGAHSDGYGYSRYCELYRASEGRLSPTMRQVHVAGERMFVDYAGTTLEVVDGTTGEVRVCQLFVAVLGASNYSRDRSGNHPERHLYGYAGILQADARACFNRLSMRVIAV